MLETIRTAVFIRRDIIVCSFLLWIAGAGLRITILATPPVISLLHNDLGLNETQVGIISGLPPVLFACAAMIGALLIAKTSATKTLLAGLIITATGSALRGAAYDVEMLYATTMLTGLGVALMQPALPSIVKEWLPHKTFYATAVYVNGLLLGGEVLPVAITQPVIMPMVGSWRTAYVFWGVVSLLIALTFYHLAPRQQRPSTKIVKKLVWMPDWKNPLLWKLGVMMGCVNAIYFSANFFIPRYLEYNGYTNFIDPALVALNLGQIPASIILMFSNSVLSQRRLPYLISGVGLMLALTGLLTIRSGFVIVSSASVIGFFSATVLILMLGLPTIISKPNEIHRASSLMLTVGYACAVIIPILCGLTWDISGFSTYVFYPMILCAGVLILLSIRRPVITMALQHRE